MKSHFLRISIIAALALLSCTKQGGQDKNEPSPVFHASLEVAPVLKTGLDSNHKLFWTEDDRISVFCTTTNRQYRFTGKTGDIEGVFENLSQTAPSGSLLTANYAVYPYDAEASIDTEGDITLTIPSIQKYSRGSFSTGSNPMVAVSETLSDHNLPFRNLCGYLLVRLYGKATVTGLTLQANNGEKIAGEASVKPEFGKAPALVMGASATSEISIDCGAGVQLGTAEADAVEFWFCVPPVTFSKGFTVEITDASGEKITKSVSSTVSIERNIYKMTAALRISVTDPSAPKGVDLGLSVRWAEFNVGATNAQDFGGYFAWGELEPSANSWSSYKWRKSGTDWDSVKLTKYNTDSAFGTVDGKSVLEPSDDIAAVSYGGNWRMPTDAEWKELKDNCSWTWTTLDGVKGYSLKSRIPGFESAEIFLPAAGYRYDNTTYAAGSEGGYWSSSLYKGITSYAWAMNFGADMVMRYYISRCYGHSVRAVSE